MNKTKVILEKVAQLMLHLIFWLAVLIFYTYFFDAGNKSFIETLQFSLFLMPITIATTYISIYKLIPEYLINKRYFHFILYSTYTFIISAYLVMVSMFFSLIYLSNFQYEDMAPATKNVFFVLSAVYLVTFVAGSIKLVKINLNNIEQNALLKTKILQTQLRLKEQELNYLKMQIHPHFLFNTLNTLYGFALKKEDETPEMILKLSNLLDYLLYQTDKQEVLLTEEIAHIQDYISLEKMRFNETLKVVFNTSIEDENQKIAPMLLLPFIENSFKHGKIKNGFLDISINLENNVDKLNFKVENSADSLEIENKGIGLENIRKRLELIYPNKHSLTIKPSSTSFEIQLTLDF